VVIDVLEADTLAEGVPTEVQELLVVLVLKYKDLVIIMALRQLLDMVVLLPLERKSYLMLVEVENDDLKLELERSEGPHEMDPVELADGEAVHAS